MASALRHRARILIPSLRLLLWFPLWLIGLVLLLLGLALSPWGTAWLVGQGEQRGWLSVDSVSGAPLDEFTVTGLVLTAGSAHVRIDRLHLAWADDCLFDGKLCLDALQVEGADVRLVAGDGEPPPEKPASSGGLPPIVVPFPIELRGVSLRDVDVQLADGTRLNWQRFTTGARLSGGDLTLLPTRLDGARLALPGSAGQTLAPSSGAGDVGLSSAAIDASVALHEPAAGAGVATTEAPDGPAASEPGETSSEPAPGLELPDIRLPLAVHVPSLVIDDFRLDGPDPRRIERLALRLDGEGHDVRLHSLAVTSPEADARLAARVTLQDDYPLSAHLEGVVHRAPLAGQRVTLDVSGSLADLGVDLAAEGPVTARLEATADVLAARIPFDVALQSTSLVWPLPGMAEPPQVGEKDAVDTAPASPPDTAGEPRYRVRDLQLKAHGNLQDYRVALQGQVSGSAIPQTVRVGLTGNGDLEHFVWQPLSLASADGALISHGEARWSPSLDVTASVNLQRFSLDAVTQAVSGTLDGDVRAHFAMRDAGWQLDVPQLTIDGTLQDRALSLEAKLNGGSDMHWQIDTLDLRQGRNRLTAQGHIADRLDMQGRLDAPALDSLLPALGGSAKGNFSLAGTLDAPQVRATLEGRDLRYADQRVARVSLDADVQGIDDPTLDVTLDAADLEATDRRLTRVALDLVGKLSDHRLTLDVDAADDTPLTRAALAVEGGLDAARTRYRGRLTGLSLDSDRGDLRLGDPTAFAIDLTASRFTLQPFCLSRRQGGRLCATRQLAASAEQGQAALSLEALPLDLVDPLLPEGWRAEGQAGGTVNLDWSAGGQRWRARGDLDGRLGLQGQDAYGKPWSLPETRLGLSLDASPAAADVKASVSLADAGDVTLNARVVEPTGEAGLEGRLRLEALRLAPYRSLATGLQSLEGTLDGDLTLAGALTNPELNGRLVLDGLKASGRDLPLSVADGRVAMALSGHRADLDGYVAGEEGRLLLSGQARWDELPQWQADISLDATQDPLLVAMPEFGRLHVAPDLAIQATPQRLQVRGDVDVPWARLEVGQIPPSAVSPSSDEVIITREDQADADRKARQAAEQASQGADEATAQTLSEAGMQLDVQIDLHIGPDVQLEAYGLQAALQGSLQVRQGNGPVQLFGDVNLVGGRYEAFGQDLLIRQGQVLFSGPASQPRLQFEAIRNPDATEDDVIAGLRVTGPASQPRLEVFSEPAMAESRALSYLLRGRAPDDTGSDGAMTSALIGLSLSRTGGAIGQLGQAFGVQDLSLDTAGSGEDSQVVVSGQLFDDLQVSYGVGIFSPIAELTLRYKLMQNLYVEAVTGAAQAVDLIYSFSLGRSSASP
ncbi:MULTISPECIES: translocation/assembly module TamB domain-containing protein [unclassified Modicisalibacter]|uniref:autotransporter assembly complex protein TamB n=1 Tax=unclassified Modicisalibacter TaxID=2679913 RepID=UPI001CCBEE3F